VFPHQLFDPAGAPRVVVVEEHLFFTQYPFHAGKLAFQRAAMRQWAHDLRAAYPSPAPLPVYVGAATGGGLHDIRKLVPALAAAHDKPAAPKCASDAPWLVDVASARELTGAVGGPAAQLHVCDVVDDWLRRRLSKAAAASGAEINWVETPNFMTAPSDFGPYFEEQKKSSKRPFFFAKFYTWQRQRLGILLNKDGTSPVGGKWSFDAENRKKVPKGTHPPLPPLPVDKAAEAAAGGGKSRDDAIDLDDAAANASRSPRRILAEAIQYVERHFPSAYGTLDPWRNLSSAWASGDAGGPGKTVKAGAAAKATPFPFTRGGAAALLEDFVAGPRMRGFGDYEDAMLTGDAFLWHSLLSTSINAGLVDPRAVVDRVVREHKERPSHAPLAATEGFVRQLIGWREFVRAVYEVDGRRQRTCNSYGFTRRMPEAFWLGQSGIHPVDVVTRRVLRHGYCHHIERLMVAGCFFLLCEIRPDDVYEWFSALFLDAYDWVMVPNVYGMSQGSDGGVMMTKPYVCGSNYLLKMGDWDKAVPVHFGQATNGAKAPAATTVKQPKSAGGRTWAEVWDGLFWRFLATHRERIKANPRLGMLVGTFDKMPAAKRDKLLGDAEWYLAQLDAAKPHSSK